jgi:hypothetical protein
MTLIKKMREEEMEFLRNRCWELTEGVTVPKEVDEWAEREGFGNEEEGYLVKLNGQYGYIYDEEYNHDEQTKGFLNDFALEHNLKNKEVLQHLFKKAEELSPQLPESVVLVIGDKTGFMECHEFGLFFPFGTDNSTYKQTLELLNKVGEGKA